MVQILILIASLMQNTDSSFYRISVGTEVNLAGGAVRRVLFVRDLRRCGSITVAMLQESKWQSNNPRNWMMVSSKPLAYRASMPQTPTSRLPSNLAEIHSELERRRVPHEDRAAIFERYVEFLFARDYVPQSICYSGNMLWIEAEEGEVVVLWKRE